MALIAIVLKYCYEMLTIISVKISTKLLANGYLNRGDETLTKFYEDGLLPKSVQLLGYICQIFKFMSTTKEYSVGTISMFSVLYIYIYIYI